ncbi:hypothetical protein Tco_1291620 [Tanacetum coccineum]
MLGDDDNLRRLCFVTHGLRTPVSWLGSLTLIAVAAMASVPRGPTVADLRVVYTNVNFTYDWREFQVAGCFVADKDSTPENLILKWTTTLQGSLAKPGSRIQLSGPDGTNYWVSHEAHIARSEQEQV